MVSVEHLTFHYDNDPPVLRDLSLTIRSGAITTLMGANGCGKSTLLQILTKKSEAGQRDNSFRSSGAFHHLAQRICQESCHRPPKEHSAR